METLVLEFEVLTSSLTQPILWISPFARSSYTASRTAPGRKLPQVRGACLPPGQGHRVGLRPLTRPRQVPPPHVQPHGVTRTRRQNLSHACCEDIKAHLGGMACLWSHEQVAVPTGPRTPGRGASPHRCGGQSLTGCPLTPFRRRTRKMNLRTSKATGIFKALWPTWGKCRPHCPSCRQ